MMDKESDVAMPPPQRVFSFAEIVKGRDSNVRVSADGLLYAVDYSMVMTGKDRDHAGQTLRGLSEETFSSLKFSERKMPGKGNANTKLVSFQDAIELAMVLPGKIARETRVKFSDIIKRYLAGDQSLVKEIQANAASDSPIAQMARASTGEAGSDEVSRKRRLDREDALFEIEMAERKHRLLQMTAETQSKIADTRAKTVAIQQSLLDQYTSLCPDKTLDDRARLMFQDSLLNLMPSQGVLAIESGAAVSAPEDTRPLTISMFAAEEGRRYDIKALQRIGSIMSSLYQRKHGSKASQHEQFTDGAVRPVRSYTRKDQDMLREAFSVFDAQNGRR
jgi:hypothetical protein